MPNVLPLAHEKIYENQPLRLLVDVEVDITDNTALKFKAWPPGGGTALDWTPASLVGTSQIQYDVPENVLTPVGEWRVQPLVTVAAGVIPGETFRMIVYSLGT